MKKFKVFALVFAIMLSATGLGLLFGSNQPASTQAKVSADETTNATWYNDWTHSNPTASDTTISLTAYNGSETTYTVPATATIGDKVYSVIFGSGSPEEDTAQVSLGTITNLSFDEGVQFPTNSSYLFYGSDLVSLNLSGVNTSNVTDMSSMFSDCCALTSLDLSSFKTGKVTKMFYMFYNCSELTGIIFPKNFGLPTADGATNDMESMFRYCSSLTSLDVSNFNTSNVTCMGSMFSDCSALTSITFGKNFNTSNVTDMREMFYECSQLTEITFPQNFGLPTAEGATNDMCSMFYNCSSLTSLDLSNFDTSNVTSMSSMFAGCSALTSLDLSNFNTSKVKNMVSMFEGCSSLISLDLSSFNTGKVTDMRAMFWNCGSLTSLDLSNFDTSNVTLMSTMFPGCTALQNIKMPNIMNADSTIKLSDLGLPSKNASNESISWYSLKDGDSKGTSVTDTNVSASIYAGKILTIYPNKSYAEIDKIIADATKPATPETPSTGVVLDVVLPVASIVLVLASLVAVAFVGKKKKQY